jgi:hypothetical protein
VRRQPHFEGLLPYHTAATGCDQRFLWSAQSTYLAVCSRTGYAMLPDGVEVAYGEETQPYDTRTESRISRTR